MPRATRSAVGVMCAAIVNHSDALLRRRRMDHRTVAVDVVVVFLSAYLSFMLAQVLASARRRIAASRRATPSHAAITPRALVSHRRA